MEPNNTQQKTGGAPRGNGRGPSRGGPRGGRGSFDRPKPEFDQKILAIRRVTRVVSGGRRMTFSVALAIGDKKGGVGLGTGKAGDTALAITKALKSAKKNMLKLKLTDKMSIPYETKAKYCASRVSLTPNHGRGMVSGSAVRDLLVLAGIKDVTSKIRSGSKNKLNNGRAVMIALAQFAAPKNRAEVVKEIMAEEKADAAPETLAQK